MALAVTTLQTEGDVLVCNCWDNSEHYAMSGWMVSLGVSSVRNFTNGWEVSSIINPTSQTQKGRLRRFRGMARSLVTEVDEKAHKPRCMRIPTSTMNSMLCDFHAEEAV